MDDNKKIVCNQTHNEIDKNIVKIEAMESEQNFNPENLDVNFVEVPSMEGNHSDVSTKPKRRTRRCNKSQISALPKHGSTDLKLILKKERFRPIRPKPLQSGSSILRHKYGLPMMNMTTLSPNRIIVPNTVPIKEKIRYVASSNVSNKNNCIKPNSSNKTNNSDVIGSINIDDSNIVNNSDNSNTVNIPSVIDKNKIDKTVKTQNSNTITNNCKNNSKNNTNNTNNSNNNSNSSNNNSNSSNNSSNNGNSNYGKDSRTNKEISKFHKNSIELFFESMAQTVLNLPNEVQADIKMQICKIVTKAEIQYCGSQAKSKTEN